MYDTNSINLGLLKRSFTSRRMLMVRKIKQMKIDPTDDHTIIIIMANTAAKKSAAGT